MVMHDGGSGRRRAAGVWRATDAGRQRADPAATWVHRSAIFAVIAFALLMMSIDETIMATILHTLQQDLGTTINWAGWTITAYAFGFLLMLPVSSTLCERHGNRRVFLWSVLGFTLASLCCGLVDNVFVLIALRAVQAVAGAGFTPSATGIVVEHFGSARDRYVALFGSVFLVGVVLGPIFGGVFVTWLSWRWAFFVNVPIGVSVLAAALKCIPADGAMDAARGHIDLPGLALLGTGLVAGMLAISYLGQGHGMTLAVVLIAGTLIAFLVFRRFFAHLRTAHRPFMTPRLIYGRGFMAVNVLNIVYGAGVACVATLIPLYAVDRYGIDALDSGILLVVQGGAAAVTSFAAALAIRRSGYRLPIAGGVLLAVAGTAMLAVPVPGGLGSFAWLVVASVLLGAGGGVMNPASRNAGLQLAPEHSASLTALRLMAQSIGSIATVSAMTAVLARAAEPGRAQALIYAVAAVVMLLLLPLVRRIPEHRGTW
ncbi:MAG TPA: MFS transporter [Nevskiaceae bacterium]